MHALQRPQRCCLDNASRAEGMFADGFGGAATTAIARLSRHRLSWSILRGPSLLLEAALRPGGGG